MKCSRLFFFFVLMAAAAVSFGAYDGTKPADNTYVADVPALVRENFRALKDDAIVNAGTVAGFSVGSASGNIPRNDGSLNTNLNVDKLDNYHGSDYVATTTVQTIKNKTIDSTNFVADAAIASTITRDSELAAVSSACNASDALLLRLNGSRAMTGNLKLNGNWLSNDGDSEGVYVGATGRVGIGTSIPSELFVVTGTNVKPVIGKNSHTALYTGYDSQNITALEIHAGNTGTNFASLVLSNALTNYGGSVAFATSGTAGSEKRYAMVSGSPESDSSVTVNGVLQFFTTKDGTLSEVARMTKQKNLLIGTTTDDGSSKVQVKGKITAFRSDGTSSASFSGEAGHCTIDSSTGCFSFIRGGSYLNTTMMLNSTGNVLIGTTTDDGTNKLQVNGSAAISGDLTVTGASTNFRNAIKAVDGAGSGLDADTVDTYHAQISAANGTIPVRDSSDGHINITGSNVNGAAYVVTTGSGNSAVYGLNNSSGGIGAEGRSDGASGVGLYGMANGTSGIGVKGVGPSGGYDFYASGSGTDYGTSSSIRWKKNRKPIQNALGIVEKLEGIRFTWDKEHGGIPGVGFIAEEVGKYLPEIVVWDAKAPGYADGMDYSKMTPLLLQAIKELHAKVQRRTSDNAALLRKIEKQEREIDELREEMRVMRGLFEAAVGDKADYDRMDGHHAGEYIQTN